MSKAAQPFRGTFDSWRQRLKTLYLRIRSLQGDPHYVAMGMAVGVFVAFTPTIPFHTILTIALAFVFKCSKPAALIGSWLNNPLTFPAFYYGSYKLGVVMLGHAVPMNLKYDDIKAIMTLGGDVAVAMIAGGALLGILPAVGAYFLTLHLFRRIRMHRSSALAPSCGSVDTQVDPYIDGADSRDRTENKDN
jgi:uncharacterized protein (DUF2062 family)